MFGQKCKKSKRYVHVQTAGFEPDISSRHWLLGLHLGTVLLGRLERLTIRLHHLDLFHGMRGMAYNSYVKLTCEAADFIESTRQYRQPRQNASTSTPQKQPRSSHYQPFRLTNQLSAFAHQLLQLGQIQILHGRRSVQHQLLQL